MNKSELADSLAERTIVDPVAGMGEGKTTGVSPAGKVPPVCVQLEDTSQLLLALPFQVKVVAPGTGSAATISIRAAQLAFICRSCRRPFDSFSARRIRHPSNPEAGHVMGEAAL